MIGRSIGIQAGRLEEVIVALKRLPVSSLNKLCKKHGSARSRLATTVNIPNVR